MQLLEDQGLLNSQEAEGKRVFSITADGRRELTERRLLSGACDRAAVVLPNSWFVQFAQLSRTRAVATCQEPGEAQWHARHQRDERLSPLGDQEASHPKVVEIVRLVEAL